MMRWKCQALLLFSLCACAYAIDDAPLKERQRTAKLIRNYPDYGPITQRVQTLDSPMYNFIDPYGPGTYAFGYEIEDPQTGNVQFRDEEKLKNGTVRGSYGYMQPDGSVIITSFVADEGGYRAKTEIRRANGQTVASFPAPAPSSAPGSQDRYFPAYDQQASTINPAIVAALQQQQHINLNPTYNPILDPGVIDPQYAAAIVGHIRDQQYSPGQGLVQYPYGIPTAPFPNHPQHHAQHLQQAAPPLYDAPPNVFSNFIGQLPASFNPYNLYQNLQSSFPQVLPQQNPLDQLANSIQGGFQQQPQQGLGNGFGNFFAGAQNSFQQFVPQGGFGSWIGQNRVPLATGPGQQQFPVGGYGYHQQQQQQQQIAHQQILSSNRPTNVLGDMPVTGPGTMGSMLMNGQYVPTTRRRKLTGTTKKRNKLKTRDGMDWFDDFLENRKRQVMYSAGTATTPETVTEMTLSEGPESR
ncbi:AGAP013248-PA [Anopheles gambiae str. PEST]|uniref:AGAP013248-PA n=1 Tax=Anopheles gambiae TaxID=7165 RepID=F5HLX2_ANOGA|nr:AGAP013248-PA [Anopheles gambiae str. PEST]